jgi:2-(3-amino-3-carboxypropyl)histidine synthase
MEIMGYDLDVDGVLEEIKGKGYQTIALQFPDGLRDFYGPIADRFEAETGALVVVSADPSYGACDLADDEVEKIQADCLVHFGHTAMPHLKKLERVPVYFVGARSTHEVSTVTKKALASLEGKRIGVIATTQHLHKLPEVTKILEQAGFEPVVREGDARTAAPGQVLGCNYTTAIKDADSYLYIGSGYFHPLGLALNTAKRIVCADPYSNEVRTMEDERDRFLKQRYGAIASVRDAQSFGILVSTKQGQLRWKMAQALKKRLTRKGRKAYVVVLKQFSPDYLINFRHLDAFVSTACPRVAIDDYGRYPKPIVTPIELEIAIGDRPIDDYRLDEIYGTSI